MRPLRRVTVVAAAVAALLAPAPAARDDAALQSADPPDRSVLAEAPSAVTLTFHRALRDPFTAVMVTAADGTAVPVVGRTRTFAVVGIWSNLLQTIIVLGGAPVLPPCQR